MFSEAQAIVLGAVQGLTEFLPVSSSAHLIIVPWLFGWKDPGLAFDVMLHLGTLVALLIYYAREWLGMAFSLFNHDLRRRKLLLLLVAASVPGAIVGLLFEKQAETLFRSPLLIAVAMALLGLALWIFDQVFAQKRSMSEIGWADAIVIGLAQALAIVPGVSRSGATITVGRLMSIERCDAANFSFLMATPIIAGASLVEGRHLFSSGVNGPLVAGFLAATLFGLAAIAALVRFVQVRSYAAFALYRLVVAALIFAAFLIR